MDAPQLPSVENDRLLTYDDDIDASPVMLATVQLVEAATTRWAETLAVRNTPAHAWAKQPMPLWMARLHEVVQDVGVPLLIRQFVCKVRVFVLLSMWGVLGVGCVG